MSTSPHSTSSIGHRRGTWEDATYGKKEPLRSKSRSFTELQALGDDVVPVKVHEGGFKKVEENQYDTKSTRDAATQTTSDVATQTDETDIEACYGSGKELRATSLHNEESHRSTISTQTILLEKQEGKSNSPVELDKARKLFSSLNDLEEEIARLRFKAMSLQESSLWLAREKCHRPTRPVISDEEGEEQQQQQQQQFFRGSPNQKGFSSFTMKRKLFQRSLSVPAKLVGAVHPPLVDFSHSAPIEGPDQSKFREIRASSAFKGAVPINQLKRLSKSLDTIPEMKLSFHHGRFYVQEEK